MFRQVRELVWLVSHKTATFRGKERAVAWLARPRKLTASLIRRGGVTWEILGHDLNEFALAVRGRHSPDLEAAVERLIEENRFQVMWDVGANIGATSLPLLGRFPNLISCLFEPSPEVAGRLVRNISLNASLAARARVFPFALSDRVGVGQFFVSSEPHNSGTGGLGNSHNRTACAIGVQMRTGDSLVADGTCPAPELIKIDVEGFERECLAGMVDILRNYSPIVVFEHAPYRLEERGMHRRECIDFLESAGYEVMHLDGRRLQRSDDLGREADFIARRPPG